MLNGFDIYNHLKSLNVNFFSGVPDSVLKDFTSCIEQGQNHIISANEGGAIGLAMGHHLASGEVPMVYMQNSGLGNAINPILSMADSKVYNIPMLLFIGYRGMSGIKDEPQHVKQGLITEDLLKIMGIDYQICSDDAVVAKEQITRAFENIKDGNNINAILIKKGTFEKYSEPKNEKLPIKSQFLNIEKAMNNILQHFNDSLIISTTGKISRRVYKYRQNNNQDIRRDFLTVGSMGHVSQIALALAMNKKDKKVICLDGDGSVIMHMGGLSNIGQQKPDNLMHIILNNECHDSVGGQKTAANIINFEKLSQALGYKTSIMISSDEQLDDFLQNSYAIKLPALINVKVDVAKDGELPRPENMEDRKKYFMNLISNNS